MQNQLVKEPVWLRCAVSCHFLRWLVALLATCPLLVSAANFYSGISPTMVPWTNGIVPYEFTNSLTTNEQTTYLDGLREWELAAHVQFVPHTNQPNWILFCYNTNFIDYVNGESYSPQVITVSSLSRAQVCHEMGHSFGFNHENIRPDATNYVIVLTNNIADEPEEIGLFVVDPTTVPYGNYDFESVMHLGWDFDSINPGVAPTMQPTPPYFSRYQYRMGNYCLSPGDRAALAYLYGPPLVPLTNIVTTTADVGPGSLRAAIYYATDHPGTTISFDIPTSDPGYSNGVFNLHLTGMLPPLVTDGTIIDGSTQPGFTGKPLIVVDASQILSETFTSDTFLIYSADNQIKNIAFTGFDWNGMTLEYADATNNTISGCWFGLDATGTNAAPNAFQGILIAAGASRNIIGGTNALERNVLSGNSQYGVFITDTNTTGNVVLGNYIGTDASGSNAVPNGKSGVFIGNGASGNIIGGTNMAGGNILSGNSEYGIILATNTTANVVLGNYIGTDTSGSYSVANTIGGVFLATDATDNYIGGTVPGARNVISGNTNGPYYDYGVLVAGSGASGNVIEGNYIGLDADGLTPVPNYYGVYFYGGATNNTLGGTVAGAGNYISGNISYDVLISDPGTSGNFVEGNFIGTDATGTNGVAGFINVELQNGATGNFIGGVNPGAGNVITAASFLGVVLYDAGTTNNAIRGNSIFNNYMGIHLVGNEYYPYVTPNDVGDGDTGPNNLQNFPVITDAFGYGTSTVVSGTLNSATNGSFLIDVYRNFQPDLNIGGYGEGQFYAGTVSVTTDGSGNASFSLTNTAANYSGQYFTATATDAGGNTSEFDLAVLATNLPVASAQFAAPFAWHASGFVFSLNLATNFSYRIQAATNLAAPISWSDLTNFTATNPIFNFTDLTATNSKARFYRVVSP
ncbi:MAG TPA: M12 family metallopeptidase [Candidatus Aquilonibacter sp.]|nr:M12 family metallopeptidase [Candidatus Aquilonibacter sp.]